MRRPSFNLRYSTFRGILISLALVCVAVAAHAQNTKGDQPVAPGRQTRETKFKVRHHKGDHAKTKDIAGRRLRTKNYHSPNRANVGAPEPRARRERPERGFDRPYQGKENPIGKRLRPRNREGARARNYYPSSGPYVSNPSRKPGMHHPDWSKQAKRIPVRKPSAAPHRTYNPANFSKARRIPSSRPVHYNPDNFKTVRRTRYNPAGHVYPSSGPYVHNPSRKPGTNHPNWSKTTRRIPVRRPGNEAHRTYRSGNFKVTRVSPGNKPHKFYPASGPYVNNPSPKPGRAQPYSNKQKLNAIARSRSQPPGPGKHRILVQSASHNFISRKPTNFMARFPRAKTRSNVYVGKDLTGHPLLKRNYHSQGQVFEGAVSPYENRKRKLGDHVYNGKRGGYKSATRAKPLPWQGDITGRRVKGRNYHSNLPGAGVALGRNEPANAKRLSNYRGNLRRYGNGPAFSEQGANYSGNIKTRRPAQGGGSASASWNNNGKPVIGKGPSVADQRIARYQGNIRRYGKGRAFNEQGENYAGNIRAKKPLKGAGGSASASWNNQGKPIVGRGPSGNDERIARYQGNIRTYGKGRAFSEQGENYAGNIKAKRPEKGAGGSASASWNNQGKPIIGHGPTSNDQRIARYQGNIRTYGKGRAFNEQGENFAGNIKAKKPEKGAGGSASHSWNNEGKAIANRGPTSTDNKVRMFSGTVKAQRPLKGAGGSSSGEIWNNKQKAVAVKLPTNSEAWRTKIFQGTVRVKPGSNAKSRNTEGLHIKVKEAPYARNKASDEKALKGIAPSRSSMAAANSNRGVKRDWQYVRNPNSDDDALKVHDPGRAVAKSANYQGNVRMRRYNLFGEKDTYPDARFEKTKKDNVSGERGIFNSVLLMWSKIFGKGGTMPSNTKEKPHRPRFDKGEKGLWYD